MSGLEAQHPASREPTNTTPLVTNYDTNGTTNSSISYEASQSQPYFAEFFVNSSAVF